MNQWIILGFAIATFISNNKFFVVIKFLPFLSVRCLSFTVYACCFKPVDVFLVMYTAMCWW
jgi:hypothetical protein